jgi:uncharacterized membrane-anchored protein
MRAGDHGLQGNLGVQILIRARKRVIRAIRNCEASHARDDKLSSHLMGKSAMVWARGTRMKRSCACVMGAARDAMSRKRSHTLESVSDSAITWFFVGLMLIAAIAGVLGQIGFG